MRYFDPGIGINANLLREIIASMADAQNQLFSSISSIDEHTYFTYRNFTDEMERRKNEIVHYYFNDLIRAFHGKFSANTEDINSIHFGKMQDHTLSDYLLIEGAVVSNQEIMSTQGLTGMLSLTHIGLAQEMKHRTYDLVYEYIQSADLHSNEQLSPVTYCDHLTRFYLHLAIEKIVLSDLFHLKNRPFQFFYGEPNYYYYSVYYLE